MYDKHGLRHQIPHSAGILLLSLCLLLFTSATASAAAADQFADVTVSAEKVAGNVYMLVGSGGNIGVSVGPDGTLIIDDQYAPLAARIQAAISELGGAKPKLVLNTHFHGDHTGGNPDFGAAGTIIAHENVRIRLLNDDGFDRIGLPLVTFSDRLRVHFNDDQLDIIHLPAGHTDGDSIIWFKNANVMHLGDHFFNGMFPFIDLDNGGSVHGYLKNLDTVLATAPEDVHIIPGHGKLGNLVQLKESLEMIRSTLEDVEEALAENRTEAEIIEAGVAQRWKSYSWAFINEQRWLEILIREVTGPGVSQSR